MSSRVPKRSFRQVVDRLFRPGGPAANGADPKYLAELLVPLAQAEGRRHLELSWRRWPVLDVEVSFDEPGTVNDYGYEAPNGTVRVTAAVLFDDGVVREYAMSIPAGSAGGGSVTVADSRSIASKEQRLAVLDRDASTGLPVTEIGLSSGYGKTSVWVRCQSSFADPGVRVELFSGTCAALPVRLDRDALFARAGHTLPALTA